MSDLQTELRRCFKIKTQTLNLTVTPEVSALVADLNKGDDLMVQGFGDDGYSYDVHVGRVIDAYKDDYKARIKFEPSSSVRYLKEIVTPMTEVDRTLIRMFNPGENHRFTSIRMLYISECI